MTTVTSHAAGYTSTRVPCTVAGCTRQVNKHSTKPKSAVPICSICINEAKTRKAGTCKDCQGPITPRGNAARCQKCIRDRRNRRNQNIIVNKLSAECSHCGGLRRIDLDGRIFCIQCGRDDWNFARMLTQEYQYDDGQG